MNTKFTAGPWFHALQAGTETQHFIYGPQGKPRIAEVLGNSTEQIAANARLIAAAPAMFSALLECELLLGEYPVVLRQVKAALAQAEGK